MTRGEELAWCAALFEGEGCLTFCEKWTASVRMTDEDMVRRFHQWIGIGTVMGPYVSNERRRNGSIKLPYWAWQIRAREDILNFCASLSPMMGERRTAKMKDCLAYLVP